MNVFVQNLPDNVTHREVERTLGGPLRQCGVEHFNIEKHRNKGNATVTILDPAAGQAFLRTFGTIPSLRGGKPGLPLRYNNQQLRIVKDKHEPSDFAVRALAREQNVEQRKHPQKPPPTQAQANQVKNEFACDVLQVGNWEYAKDSRTRNDSKLVFTSYFAEYRTGRVIFGRREAKIILGDSNSVQHRIDIPYHDCRDIILGTSTEPTVSFTLHITPKLYELDPLEAQDTLSPLLAQMQAATLNPQIPQPSSQQTGKKYRVASINPRHARVAGHCFVYRIALLDKSKLARIRDIVSRSEKCTSHSLKTAVADSKETMDQAFIKLNHELSIQGRFGNHSFQLLYQVDRLARNGYLPPNKVVALLPHISRIFKTHGLDQTVAGLRLLSRNLPLPGPDTQAQDFSIGALEEALEGYVVCYDGNGPDNPYELSKRYEHINLIHRVVVTPTHIRLEGPEPEPTNRVLRLHSSNTDHFVRVVFQDEDGDRVKFDWSSNSERIYHGRFKNILDTGISIAGKVFSFLGFSHSSLRSQSCWFMAPFIMNGTLKFAEHVIKDLGHFSDIRIPAKCAARIGQNFTDTNTSVTLINGEVFDLQAIERSGYDFADGAGTISQALLREVWKVYGTKRMLKPTALQIRFQGAKGMVALDTRLTGKRLMVRRNMRKYDTKDNEHMNLEICGAAFRPLPMILNRGFIKILEDLGVPLPSFMDLQNAAMHRLRLMTQSAINTGTLLDEVHTSKASGLPSLIRYLGQIGLDYHLEPFLYAAVELAIIAELRDIKHRGRIPVPKGVTLFGLPDETGILKEGEIFVITERAPEGGKKVEVWNNVIITRSPALHPGDIQVANAVDVPYNSPLRQLSNVVVFSKWGQRDLPSKLAGGDLDGDLYNVIWDETLIPRQVHAPAAYPRLAPKALPRDVTRKDMSDFFVTFMENDKLGMISNQHLQLADQQPMGTLDRGCIQLAALASTAVDYSKTGIPADMSRAPRPAKFKPDYMAPTPRVLFSKQGLLDLEEEDSEPDEAFDSIDADRRPMRYYESHKALGKLYRNIDERQFLADMQKSHHRAASSRSQHGLIHQLLDYVVHTATVTFGGNMYKHHKDLARQIRNSYEESLTNLMCDCEPTPHKPLSEIEVFAGQILGRQNGPDGRMLRELSDVMRGRFEKIVDYANMRITHGDDQMQEVDDLDDLYGPEYSDRELEALPRAIACLEVAVKETGYEDRTVGELISFKYIAAVVALKELDRYRVTTHASYAGLPPLSSIWDGIA